MRAQLAALAREGDKSALTLLAELDSAAARGEFTALKRSMSGHSVTIRAALDRSVGASARGLGLLSRAVTRSTGALTAHTTAVGGATLKYTSMTAALGETVGLVGGLGAAAGTAAGSLLVLPAAGIAAAVAVKTLTLGVEGLGDALKAESPEEYAKAIERFAPPMRETADAARALKPELDGLRVDVQAQLFAGLGQQVSQLGGRYLPMLRRELSTIAGGYNTAAIKAAGFADRAGTAEDVEHVLGNTSTAVRQLSDAAIPLVAALVDVSVVGSDFLPGFATRVGESTTRLASFTSAARESGQLNTWLDNGFNALGDLGTILANLASALFSILSAANSQGAGLLGTLVALSEGMANYLRSAQGAHTLEQVFGGLHAAVVGAAPLVVVLGQLFAGVLAPAIAQLGPVVGQALGSLAPALEPVAKLLLALVPLLATVAQVAASLVVPALGLLAGLVDALAPALRQVVAEVVGSGLVSGITSLTPALVGMAQSLTPLIILFGQFVSQVLRVLAPLFAQLLTVATPVADLLGRNLLAALSALLPLALVLVTTLGKLLDAALRPLLPVLPVLLDGIVELGWALTTGLSAATPALVQIGRLLGDLVGKTLIALIPLVAPLTQALLGLVVGGLAPLITPVQQLVDLLLPPLLKLLTDWTPLVVRATETVTSMAVATTTAAAVLVDKLMPTLTWLVDGVVMPVFARLVEIVDGALRALQGVIDMAIGLITGDWQRAWTGLRDFLGGTWDLIVATTKLLVVDLMTMLADLPRAIFDLFADVGGLLFEAGKNLIKGLVKGIEHGWGWVKDKLGSLTDMLPEWKGPPARDRNLLRGNGNLLMRGLVEGLADGEPQVRRYLADLTDSLPAMVATVEPAAPARATTTGAAVRGEDLAAFTDAVRRLAERPVVVKVGAVEIARATAEGNRSLARR
ncbi:MULTISPECIES: hypothetical protein [Actinosynnema]|uniref:phage tail protein n=1 Tax=Actinosynnema TaxID=40566 RepID=UPI0020A48AA0|nr:hypothetical protein [Actinosynnema pretiosum]MCP2092657.1 Phage-related protein [Actinosynnema pretiosum]